MARRTVNLSHERVGKGKARLHGKKEIAPRLVGWREGAMRSKLYSALPPDVKEEIRWIAENGSTRPKSMNWLCEQVLIEHFRLHRYARYAKDQKK